MKRASYSWRVLIVDDNSRISKEIATEWQLLGCNPHPVASLKDAYSNITKNKPDLIILDLHMPKTGGEPVISELQGKYIQPSLAFCEWVTSNPGTSDVLIYFYSADKTEYLESLAIQAGAQKYYKKTGEKTMDLVMPEILSDFEAKRLKN